MFILKRETRLNSYNMKFYKPTTKSRRHMSTISYGKHLTASEPHKALTSGFKRDVGRNNTGGVMTRHHGAGHKRLYREIDFVYNKKNVPGSITTVEYDPNRTGFIALVTYADGEKRYVLIPKSDEDGVVK